VWGRGCPLEGSTTLAHPSGDPIFVSISWRTVNNADGLPLAMMNHEAQKEADTMTRRSLLAWLLMAVVATPAMMPAVANAHPVSIQDRSRSDVTTQRRVSDRAYADSVRWSGGGKQAYNPPSRASSLSLSSRSQAYRPPSRVSPGFAPSRTTFSPSRTTFAPSRTTFAPSRTKQYRAPLVLRHDYRRR
jgi:hypothetical protein